MGEPGRVHNSGTHIGTSTVSSSEDTTDESHRRIFSSMSTGFTSTIIVSVLGAVSIRAMTTRLGAAQFGIFVLVTAYVSLVQTFTDLGLAQVLQRDVAQGDQDEGTLLGQAMGLRGTLSLVAVPIAVAVGLLIYANRSSTMKIGLVLMVCAIPFAVTQEVSAAHFTAALRNTVLAVASVFQQVIFVGLVVLFVSLHKSVAYCLGASMIGTILSSIFVTAMAERDVSFTPTFNRKVWYSMLRSSTPIGVAYVVGVLYFKADTVILSFLSTTRQIGFYGAAYSIVIVFLALAGIMTRTFLPSMVKASKEAIEDAIHSALAYFSICGTFSATAIMVWGPTVIRIVAGPHFGAADLPLRILGLGLIPIFFSTCLSSVCIARGFGNKLFTVSIVSLVLNVALNIAAIPRFGINGAAVATFCTELVSLSLFMHIVRRETGVRSGVIGALVRPFAAGLVTCLALAPIYFHSDLKVTTGLALMPATFVLYCALLALFRGLPQEAVQYVKSLIGDRFRTRR
jgi:O-antigen/teichoic acid export membrane protein